MDGGMDLNEKWGADPVSFLGIFKAPLFKLVLN